MKKKRTKLLVFFALAGILVLFYMIGESYCEGLSGGSSLKEKNEVMCRYKYDMIVDSPNSSFWQAVYDCAQEWAQKNDAILELRGSGRESDYSKLDYMNMSIASNSDGIILQYSGEQGLEAKINEAVQKGIPVVTVMGDAVHSKRQSFVGVSDYQLGSVYGGKQEELSGYVVHTPYENLDLIPSSTLRSSIEYELFTKWQREFILRKCIQKIKDAGNYDYILIDAPPTLGGWVMNILCASDRVIIPVEASPWGMFGLANMFEFLNEVKQITPELEVAGIAVTKVDTRKSYYKQTMETLHELEDIHVFEQIIRVDSSVEWPQDNSIPVVEYKKSSRSAREYTRLAEEVMELCQ